MSFANFTLPRPWADRTGRFSALKLACFVLCIAPGLWVLWQFYSDEFPVRPVTELIHRMGDWAMRFLIATLAITPLRRAAQYPRLVNIRRMLGLTTLAYAAIHFSLYITDQKFDLLHVAAEIGLRFYLTIGFIGFCGLCTLGWTSTDAAIRRMGALRWNRLHSLVYPIAVLALVHFALQSKRDVTEAMTLMGLFILLMLARRVDGKGTASPWVLMALALGSGVLAALAEASWYGVASGIDPWRVLAANLDWEMLPRPWVWVAAAGLVLAGLRAWRGVKASGRARGRAEAGSAA